MLAHCRSTAVAAGVALALTYAALACGAAAKPAAHATAPTADAALSTLAEQTKYARTGRFDEVQRLCPAFAARWPGQVRCIRFGTTPEGRPMLALVASSDGVLSPGDAHSRNRPVVFVQGGIHAGEIDGKDAGLEMLRDTLLGKVAPGALAKVTWVFVPVFNIDGHERFGAWNRPNQVGPAEMGWRTTAQNLNLNRDYAKADAPEMRQLLDFLNAWDPVVYADLHVTDGANFQHDVSIDAQPDQSDDPQVAAESRRLRDALLAVLTAKGSLPLPYYPEFIEDDRPESGFQYAPYLPRFQTGYWPLSNRVALLLETHSWKDYPTRVRITREFLIGLLDRVAAEPERWTKLAADADARAKQLGGTKIDLAFENTKESRTVEFRGYAYTRRPSAVSGGIAIEYDPKKPEIWRVPLFDRVTPTLTVTAPRAGYVVPAAYADEIATRLKAHGVQFERWDAARTGLTAQTFAITEAKLGATFEARTTAKLSGEWRPATVDVAPGALYVPIAQPKARLVVALLEPQAPDSFASWGFFNGAYERKEYMESYVAEQVAREMLAKDPAVAKEFEAKLLNDAAFAASPRARLEFFERRHPSWDTRRETFPIVKVDSLPQ
jgi:hypothetical protein